MSHHYSGPRFGFPNGDARLDLTDLYVFPKPGDVGRSILIMNVHPSFSLDPPGPTTSIPFTPNGMYEFRIDSNRDGIADLTYRVNFSPFTSDGQTASLRLVTGPQPAAAEGDGKLLIDGAAVSLGLSPVVTKADGHRLFAGWRSDPFFFDPLGALNGFQFGKDFFIDKDVCSIALEIPNSVLDPGPVGLWARTLTKMNGRWVQADRGARPAQSIFLTGEAKEAYLAAEPDGDVNFIAIFAHSLEHAGGYAYEHAQRLAKTLLPDILPFDHRQAASYPGNGRTLTDDVLDHFLSVLTDGKVTSDGLGPHNDLLVDFPYLGPPHTVGAARSASPLPR